jgi:3-hydroxyisobutyrate dehydrogenase-like beta-hydroxyacid dehydrogenase
MSASQRIGFLGLGIMGSRMARRYLDAGHPLSVWNRSPAPARSLESAGARVGADPADVARGADVLCLCLADPKAVSSVVEAMAPGLRRGQLVLDFSTIDPESARTLARSLGERGVDYLEAPVTGSKNGAAQGTLVLMVGGEERVLEAARPLLAVVGKQVIHCGPVGAGSQVKLIGNGFIAHMLVALAQGLALARETGIPGERLLDVVRASGFASPYFDFKGKQILNAGIATRLPARPT